MQAEGEDSLKKMQLMELAILNGTYRDANIKSRKHVISLRTCDESESTELLPKAHFWQMHSVGESKPGKGQHNSSSCCERSSGDKLCQFGGGVV